MNATATLTTARVELEIPIAAPRAQVWKSLVEDIGAWWPQDFYVTPSPRFVLEPKIGGYLYEDNGDGAGVIWFQVSAVMPGEKLILWGHIGPPYGGPATSLLTLSLEDSGDTTIFKLSDCLFGLLPDNGASMDEGWRQIFEKNFKEYVEK